MSKPQPEHATYAPSDTVEVTCEECGRVILDGGQIPENASLWKVMRNVSSAVDLHEHHTGHDDAMFTVESQGHAVSTPVRAGRVVEDE